MLLTLPLLGFYYMQRQEMYFVRWLMPFLPPMAVLAAETIHAGLWRWTAQKRTGQAGELSAGTIKPSYRTVIIVAVGIIALLLAVPSTYVALHADYVFSQPDTRTEAFNWVRQNVPPDSNVAAELLSPPWGPPLAMPGLSVGPYNYAPVPSHGVAERAFRQYQEWGVQYMVASSYHYARPLQDKARQAELAANLQTLEENAELVALFQPYYGEYEGFFYHDQVYGPANDALYRKQPGPVIRIYRLP